MMLEKLILVMVWLGTFGCDSFEKSGRSNGCDSSTSTVTRADVKKQSWQDRHLVLSLSATEITTDQYYEKQQDRCIKNDKSADVSTKAFSVEIYLCTDAQIEHLTGK